MSNEIGSAIGLLSSLMEIRTALVEDSEDTTDIDANIRATIAQGDEARKQLLKRGNISENESSTMLSFVRRKKSILEEISS